MKGIVVKVVVISYYAYPLKLNLPLLRIPYHFYENPEVDAPIELIAMHEQLQFSEAFVIVSAEYNSTIPPALSNMLDYFPTSVFAFKPAAIVAYTIALNGCTTVVEHLRSFLSELGCLVLPHSTVIRDVQNMITEDGQLSQNRDTNVVEDNLHLIFTQLE